jgi:predicted esterase
MVADQAERHGVLLLAPTSEGGTWDMIRQGYGPDVEYLDRALAWVFSAFEVDRERIAVGGFSDGASYALSLGIINGALFRDVLAFSPGFAAPSQAEDSPRIFMSHGTEDEVLPIERCSRRLAPKLRQAGFDVDYREFLGGHVVPVGMVEAAFARFLEPRE